LVLVPFTLIMVWQGPRELVTYRIDSVELVDDWVQVDNATLDHRGMGSMTVTLPLRQSAIKVRKEVAMAHYMFETEWLLTAPIESVFELISHPEDYSTWWPGVSESRLLSAGDDNGVGRRGAYTIRSPLGYKMSFETRAIEVDAPIHVSTVVRGDLVGTGTHFLESRPNGTHVRFHWYVSTTKTWMNVVAGIARPAFSFAHRYVMFNGCDGMAKALGGRLITATSKLVEAPTPIPVAQQ
jgi:uncharacterized protein YndB with AHSA1/START domain